MVETYKKLWHIHCIQDINVRDIEVQLLQYILSQLLVHSAANGYQIMLGVNPWRIDTPFREVNLGNINLAPPIAPIDHSYCTFNSRNKIYGLETNSTLINPIRDIYVSDPIKHLILWPAFNNMRVWKEWSTYIPYIFLKIIKTLC